MFDLIRKPAPKWNVLYQDNTGKFKNQLVYSDEERDTFVAKVEAEGGTIVAIYERT